METQHWGLEKIPKRDTERVAGGEEHDRGHGKVLR